VAVELTIGREDVSGEVVDHDEGSEADGHIDLGRPDERARWRSAIERMRGVLGQLELGVVRSHPEVLLDRRVDEAAAERGEDRNREEDGDGAADDERPPRRNRIRGTLVTTSPTYGDRPRRMASNVHGPSDGHVGGSGRGAVRTTR